MKYQVDWHVTEVINGPGQHDDGVRDGDRSVVARGSVVKEAASEAEIRKDLTEALTKAFPPHGEGPTYDINHVYDISIRS